MKHTIQAILLSLTLTTIPQFIHAAENPHDDIIFEAPDLYNSRTILDSNNTNSELTPEYSED